jgi:predicted DNA-binding helix-hairpin-helix protein
MDTKLEDLKLRQGLLWELHARGFFTVGDMAHLSIAESLRIPGMGGVCWRRIVKAQGGEPYGASDQKSVENGSIPVKGVKA